MVQGKPPIYLQPDGVAWEWTVQDPSTTRKRTAVALKKGTGCGLHFQPDLACWVFKIPSAAAPAAVLDPDPLRETVPDQEGVPDRGGVLD